MRRHKLGQTLRGTGLSINNFELGVEGEGQDTSRNFEGSFGFIRAILSI